MSFRWFAISGVLALTLLAAQRPLRAAGPAPRPTVAFLYFDYEGSDAELGYLRKGLAQMLSTDLAGTAGVEVVERHRLEDVLGELKLQGEKKIDKKSAVAVGKLLGARYLVVGDYLLFQGQLRVSARVLEVETGKVLFGAHRRATPDAFFEIEEGLRDELGTYLSRNLTGSAPAPAAKPQPRPKSKAGRDRVASARPLKISARTVSRYGRALDHIDSGASDKGRRELESIVAEHPELTAAAIDLKALAK